MKKRTGITALLLAAGLTGCFQKKPKIIPVAVPPTPVTAPPASVVPEGNTPEAKAPEPKAPEPKKKLKAGPTAKPGKPAVRPSPPAPTLPPPAAAAPPASAPLLGEILTEAKRRQYEGDFAQSMRDARAALNLTTGHRLSVENRQTMERIGTFLLQADESKPRDLVTALQLARRANLLAQDLLKSLQ